MDLWALAELKESVADRTHLIIYHDMTNMAAHAQVWVCLCMEGCVHFYPKWLCLHLHHLLTTTSRHDSHNINEIGVGRFYFKHQDLKETCSFPFSHLLIKTSVSDLLLSLVLLRVMAVDCAPQGHWAGPLFHLSKCLSPLIFHCFSLLSIVLLLFGFSSGKAEFWLWMENVN